MVAQIDDAERFGEGTILLVLVPLPLPLPLPDDAHEDAMASVGDFFSKLNPFR